MISKNECQIGWRAVVDLDPARLGQDQAHLLLQVVPVAGAVQAGLRFAEVVENDEPALFQIGAEALGFLVGHRPEARLRHVGDRIVEQLRIVERQDVRAVEARLDVGDLLQDLREVDLAARIVVRPLRPAASAAEPTAGGVAQPDEHEAAVVGGVALVLDRRALLEAAAEALRRRTGKTGDGRGRA